MRTTLTLDDDIATQLTCLRDERKMSLREAVNTAMRKGLAAMSEPKKSRKPVKTLVFDGKWLVPGNVVSTHDMLTHAEGEAYR
jgi:hypothetical protein